jgi:glycosyltransferase involved in cell wall biosynthesis
LDVLAAAMPLTAGAQVEVIGNGPLEALAREAFGAHYLGFRPLQEIMQRMGAARFMVLPSICYENSPRTIVEAYACGLPVIASRLGALADIVHEGVTGLLFNPGDAADLAVKIAWATANPKRMARMGQAARAEYEAHYTPERNYATLMDIYEDAITALHQEPHAA